MATQKIKVGYIDSGTANVNQAIVFDGANVVWSNVTTDTSAVYDTANAAFNKANTAGGGFYQGNNGNLGTSNFGDIFRTHTNTLTGNVTIPSSNNSIAAGPLSIANGASLTIQDGARVAIV